MRRVLVAGVAGALLLTACTDDGDPTVAQPPSETATEFSPEPIDAASEPQSSEPASEPGATDAPSTIVDPTESEPVDGEDVGTTLMAELTGDAEVPGPGDPGGTGTFVGTITSSEAGGELCYLMRVDGLSSEATAAHVHQGGVDASGGVFIDLTAPTEGEVEECVALNATEMVPLLDGPSGYYVNVHTAEYPDGAIRGQLSVASA